MWKSITQDVTITSFLGVLYHSSKSLATKRAADPPKSAGERRKTWKKC